MNERGFSDDHIPPRSCGNARNVAYRRLYADEMSAPQAQMPSANGIRYATVCERCNNGRGPDDAAAAEFVERVRAIERSPVHLSGALRVPARANQILRAVLGWFLAARLDERESATDALLRAYLDGDVLDQRIVVHFWPYSGEETIIARDFTSFNVYEGTAIRGTASVIKFPPIAVMLVHGEPLERFPRLDLHSGGARAFEVLLPWDRATAPAAHWPERPDETGNVVMGGAEFINAVSSFSGFFGKAMMDEQRRRAATVHASRGMNRPQRYAFFTDDGTKRELYFVR